MNDSTRVTIAELPLENPYSSRSDVHYRHYISSNGAPRVVCVQDFDYYDYAAERFLSTDAWDTELEAESALSRFLTQIMPAAAADQVSAALKAAGVGLTRLQAMYAFLQERAAVASNTPTPAQVDALNAVRRELALELRTHAWEQVDRTVREHLMKMADVADGGVGPHAHHGCPDYTIPTADCTECAIVLDAEVEGRGRPRTMFADLGQYSDD